jgi:hypothetical protein
MSTTTVHRILDTHGVPVRVGDRVRITSWGWEVTLTSVGTIATVDEITSRGNLKLSHGTVAHSECVAVLDRTGETTRQQGNIERELRESDVQRAELFAYAAEASARLDIPGSWTAEDVAVTEEAIDADLDADEIVAVAESIPSLPAFIAEHANCVDARNCAEGTGCSLLAPSVPQVPGDADLAEHGVENDRVRHAVYATTSRGAYRLTDWLEAQHAANSRAALVEILDSYGLDSQLTLYTGNPHAPNSDVHDFYLVPQDTSDPVDMTAPRLSEIVLRVRFGDPLKNVRQAWWRR